MLVAKAEQTSSLCDSRIGDETQCYKSIQGRRTPSPPPFIPLGRFSRSCAFLPFIDFLLSFS
jgi:hypothetical protein